MINMSMIHPFFYSALHTASAQAKRGAQRRLPAARASSKRSAPNGVVVTIPLLHGRQRNTVL